MAQATTGPDSTSSDYDAMLPVWEKAETILAGRDAVIAAGEAYLPRFPNETLTDYQYRLTNAKFTNVYSDIVTSLAAKPFSEEVALADGAPERFSQMSEDIDGRGNNLHVFAAETFFGGVNYAVDWILVDYTKARSRTDGQPLSIADERDQGLRPYWVHIPAKRLLAVYSATVRGREIIVHARIREDATERDGFGEVTRQRVRVLDRAPIYDADGKVVSYAPATFTVYEKSQQTDRRRRGSWDIIEQGPITIGVIALVPFITGRRIDGTWRFKPPMQDVADLQVEHYQQETALKAIKELTAYPMLAGNGVQPATENGVPVQVPVGPKSVLYAPPFGDTGNHGEWAWIEPTAENAKFLAEQVDAIEEQMREIGRQPLTATAGITVVTAALASQKASSAVQAWAWGLKDALEQAFVYTAMWLNLPVAQAPEVRVFTDFAVEMQDAEGQKTLVEARKNGDISRATLWEEMKRRSILSADFDPDEEEKRIEAELPDPASEADLIGAMTPPGAPPAPNDQLAA